MGKSLNTNKKNIEAKSSYSVTKLCNLLKNTQINYKGNAIIYCRVSTKNQTFGTSLENQKELSTSYCIENNFKILYTINEVCSAKSMDKQSELIHILNTCENIHLIINDPSRVSRNLIDFTQMLQICDDKKITLHFVTDNLITNNNTDIKVAMSSVYDSEIEIKTLSKRIKKSIEQQKRNNTYCPSVTKFGYYYEKKIVGNKVIRTPNKNKNEQLLIELINKMYWGSKITEINNLLFLLTNENHTIYNKKNSNEKITRIEYGNMTFVDVANFLNSIQLLKRNREWSGSSISCIINEKNKIILKN